MYLLLVLFPLAITLLRFIPIVVCCYSHSFWWPFNIPLCEYVAVYSSSNHSLLKYLLYSQCKSTYYIFLFWLLTGLTLSHPGLLIASCDLKLFLILMPPLHYLQSISSLAFSGYRGWLRTWLINSLPQGWTSLPLRLNLVGQSVQKNKTGNSLTVQWLRLCAFTAEGLGSIPGPAGN